MRISMENCVPVPAPAPDCAAAAAAAAVAPASLAGTGASLWKPAAMPLASPAAPAPAGERRRGRGRGARESAGCPLRPGDPPPHTRTVPHGSGPRDGAPAPRSIARPRLRVRPPGAPRVLVQLLEVRHGAEHVEEDVARGAGPGVELGLQRGEGRG